MADFDVFISYSTADIAAARRLTDLLRGRGLRPFLDESELVPGERAQKGLTDALRRSNAVAVLIGRGEIGKWQALEIEKAISQQVGEPSDFRVIPVMLPGRNGRLPGGFLDIYTWVDLSDGVESAIGLDRLEAGIRGIPPQPSARETLPDSPEPYLGLQPFTQQRADVFFGRKERTDALYRRVTASTFTAVVGASGSGKSSLVRAGLLPRVPDWRALVLVPGSDPLRNLAAQLATLVPVADQLTWTDELTSRMVRTRAGLAEAMPTILTRIPETGPLLVVIDQFEEIFVYGAHSRATRFVENLVTAVAVEPDRLRVLITLRADFVQHCLALAELRSLLEDRQLYLGPPLPSDLREAIVRPAGAVGAFLETGLVARILHDVRGLPTPLPLLQVALAGLWRHRDGRWLTHAGYERSGGVASAIDIRADQIYQTLSGSQQHLARLIFLRLVSVGEQGEGTRRRVVRRELRFSTASEQDVDAVLLRLSDARARLLSVDGEQIELIHEALIQEWHRLRGWLDDRRADNRLHRLLTDAATTWDEHDRDPSYLYLGMRLAAAEEWRERNPEAVNILEGEFLAASAQQRARRQDEEEAARARAHIGEAQFQIDTKPELALLHAIAALRSAHPPASVRRAANSVIERVQVRSILRGHADRLAAVSWQPDSHLLATASYDGTAAVWDVDTGDRILELVGHDEAVVCVAWSTGGLLATGSWDGTVRIWDTRSGRCVKVLAGHDSWVSSVAWSADGGRLVTGSNDNTARIWDVGSGRTLSVLAGHQQWVRSAEWHPSGRFVLTGSYDGTAGLWDAGSGHRLLELTGHDNAVPAVSWHLSGKRALSASEDGTLALWSLTLPKRGTPRANLVARATVHTSPTYCVAWDASGRYAVTGSEDGLVRLWEVEEDRLQPVGRIPGHGGWVSGVSWSSDGHLVASSSEDATARVTKVTTVEADDSIEAHDNWVSCVRWSPEGDRLLSVGDGQVKVWRGSRLEASASDETLQAANAEWNRDGRHVVVGEYSGSIRVLDLLTGVLTLAAARHQDPLP